MHFPGFGDQIFTCTTSVILLETTIVSVSRSQDRYMKEVAPKKPHARTSGTCSVCDRVFSQVTNLKRHMGIVHQQQLDGTPIDEATSYRPSNRGNWNAGSDTGSSHPFIPSGL